VANPNGRKGSQFETDIVEHLRLHGKVAERLARKGALDEGDGYELMENRFYTMWEAKNTTRLDLPQYLKELERERVNFMNARNLYPWQVSGIVIVKRRQHSIGKSYVIQTLDQYFGLGDYSARTSNT
jgi:hypothetical protein